MRRTVATVVLVLASLLAAAARAQTFPAAFAPLYCRQGVMTDVTDSHRTLTHLVGTAREVFDDGLSARQQAGLVRFEQAVARRILSSGARVRAWVKGRA